MTLRHTLIAHGHLARGALRLDAARNRLHGRQILTFEALACRLAGDFTTAIDDDALRGALQRVLPETELGELEAIKLLPGMVDAAAGTLRKIWRSGIDLQIQADRHPAFKRNGDGGSGAETRAAARKISAPWLSDPDARLLFARGRRPRLAETARR